jgi:hypothetical protein
MSAVARSVHVLVLAATAAASSLVVPALASATGETTVPVGSTSTTAVTQESTTTTAGTLAFEHVAEFTGRGLHPFHSDGTTIYATSMDAAFNTTFVAIDGNGAIVREVPNAVIPTIYNTVLVNGQVFLLGHGPGACGFFPIDVASFTVGSPIAINDGSSCSSGVALEPEAPSVAWVIDNGTTELVRADLTTGEIAKFPFGAAIPEHYEPWSVTMLGGIAYVSLAPLFDEATGQQFVGPDGSPLPELILRFDPATATGATVAGWSPEVINGTLVVNTDEGTMALDPVAMTLSPFEDSTRSMDFAQFDSDGTAWHAFSDFETGELVVIAQDPTGAEPARGTFAGPFDPEWWVDTEIVLLGDVPYLVASQNDYDDATQQTTMLSEIYRISRT